MPPNRKKNRRNNLAIQGQTQSFRGPKTVSCPRCNKEIVVPKTCKHGKKLINCQGTGCTRAHLDEHNAVCRPVTRSKTTNTPPGMAETSSRTDTDLQAPSSTPAMHASAGFAAQTAACGPRVTGPSNAQGSDLSKTISSTHTAAMGELSKQLTSLTEHRGKHPRYVQGIPIDEWFQGLKEGSASQVNQWTEKLKCLVEGKTTAEEIGYDDEDSDDGDDGCLTPSEDE